MYKKKQFLFVLFAVVVGLMVSCTNSPSSKNAPSETGVSKGIETISTSNLNKVGYPIVNKKITLTCMHSLGTENGSFKDLLYFKRMEDVSNIHMDFIAVPSSEWETKKNLTLASGDLPHWFYTGLSVNDLQRYGVEGGQFVDFSGLIDEYMPNLAKSSVQFPNVKKVISMLGGQIYCVPYIYDDPTCPGNTIYVRRDFMNKAGVKEKPKTIDEFYKMLVTFKEANFAEDFTPFLPDGWVAVDSFLFPSFGEGWEPGFADNGDGVVVYNIISEQYKHYLEFLNKLFAEKLLENEIFTMDRATILAKLKSNKGAVTNRGTSLTLDNFESGKYEVELFPPLTSDYTQERKLSGFNKVNMSGGTITNKCSDEEVKSLLRWMDINYSDDDVAPGLNRLSQWLGIRGETFDFIGDNDEYFRMSIAAPKDSPLSSYEWNVKYAAPGGSIANFATTAIPYNNPSQEMKARECLENLYPYMKEIFPDAHLKYSAEDQDVIANKLTDINTYVNQMKAKFITGTEPLSKWDDFVKEIEKMGIRDVLTVKQKAYDKFRK